MVFDNPGNKLPNKERYMIKTFGKVVLHSLMLLLIFSCSRPAVQTMIDSRRVYFPYRYAVDLHQRGDDLFRVTLETGRLAPANNIFNFAAVGTFARMDFGRYVRSFRVFDAAGGELPARQIATNQWLLEAPERIARIEYHIAETWDSPPGGQPIMEMLGTTIEEDFAFISGQGVFGFIKGLENVPIKVHLDCPPEWRVGTALLRDQNGDIVAQNFGALASAPILAGYLTYSRERIVGSEVAVYCYSKTDRIVTASLMPLVKDVLNATYRFIGEMPIERYTMLFIFEDKNAGGVEYHNSSAFVFQEGDFSQIRPRVQDVVAHEFFHLIIPFSIRSDVLDQMNFFKPTPTAHLWFFEGVTEWASDIIQLRAGLKSIDHYILNDFRQKLFQEDIYGADISLREISLTSHRNQEEYLNVYSRGALVAALLDILLLDRTDGRRGLQDVIVDLSKDYGKERPLPEERFFEILIDYSGPEFEDFIRRYIIGNEKLPVKEMLEKLGIIYEEERPGDERRGDLGMFFSAEPGGVTVLWVDPAVQQMGLRPGDVVRRFNGAPVTAENYGEVLYRGGGRLPVGDTYAIEILREGRPLRLSAKTIPYKVRHSFSLPPMLSPQQQRVRQVWMSFRR